MPTLLDYLEIPKSEYAVQGKSLKSFIDGKQPPSTSYALSESITYGPERKALRFQDGKNIYKTILAPRGSKMTENDRQKTLKKIDKPWTKDVYRWGGREFYDLNEDPKEKKNLALALWTMVALVGPISGPILGGWLTQDYSWPWIFYINLALY